MLGFSEEISKKWAMKKLRLLGQYPFKGLWSQHGGEGSSFIYSFNKHGASGVHRDNTAMPIGTVQLGKELKLKQINTISRGVAVSVLKLVIRVL